MTEFDPTKAFTDAFLEEVAEAEAGSPSYSHQEWYASGRATKEWPDKRNQDWWLTNGPGQVQSYVDWRNETQWPIANLVLYVKQEDEEPTVLPAIELEVLGKIGENEERGYIDRVFVLPNGDFCIVDIKTGRVPSNEHQQLGLYAELLFQHHGIKPRWGGYWTPDKGFVGPFDLSKWVPGVLASIHDDAAERIERGQFPPNPKDNCKAWCSVAPHCAIVGGSKAAGVDPLYEVMFPLSPTERKEVQ